MGGCLNSKPEGQIKARTSFLKQQTKDIIVNTVPLN